LILGILALLLVLGAGAAVAAFFLVISSLTGMVTLVALRARRRTGFAVCLLGILSVLLIYMVWVPK